MINCVLKALSSAAADGSVTMAGLEVASCWAVGCVKWLLSSELAQMIP